MKITCLLLLGCIGLIAACTSVDDHTTWEVYGGDKAHSHYSSLDDIDTSNVARLQVAWKYHTGDSDQMTQIQVNPIVVNGILYGVSPKLKLFALEAATGREKWVFKPDLPTGSAGINACRGVTYFNGGEKDQRLFYGVGSFMYCIDALSGLSINSFGDSGKVDLHNDLGAKAQELYVAFNTPGVIYKDLIVVGVRVSEEAAAAPGHIRAYDVHSGKLRWIFHTIPQPGEPGFETWEDSLAYKHIGGANAWAGFTLDEKNGMLFAPIGSASYDFYGGKRWGANLYANCVLALDAATGKHIWHYQTVHHDVWDRDPPTAPVLVTVTKDGKKIDAVAQPTKTGFIFLLNRKTGEPIYPIEEKPVPTAHALPGEKLFPTQPMPNFPEPFVRQAFPEDMLNRALPDSSYQDIKSRFAVYKNGSMYTPPSREGTIIFPGTDGGAEWGGPAYDPVTNVLYINANEVPWVLTMVDVKKEVPVEETYGMAGKRLFTNHCMSCHGSDKKGGGNNPSLIGVNAKYKKADFLQLLANGRRMMPAFAHLSDSEREAIASFILENKQHQKKSFVPAVREEDAWHLLPYKSTGYHKFLSKEGYPAVAPPWGTLNAVDLNTGKIAWKETLGDYSELKAKGIHSGTENYGGPAVTAGGLVFIAATSDAKIRAFHKRTGKLLWENDLPACGFATPSVYAVDGRQYVVIACGGGKLKKPSGDAYVAFALPAAEK